MQSRWDTLGLMLWLGAVLLLGGCGSGSSVPLSVAPQYNTLAGNWLLAGSVPVFPAPLQSGTRLTMTFSSDGSALRGSGDYFVTCGDIGDGASVTVQGKVAADGSFTAQTSLPASGLGASLVLQGHVPAAAGEAWTGSYALDTTHAGSCKVQDKEPLTALPISAFSGTYTGEGTLTDGTTQTPVTVRLVLQQGVELQDTQGTSITNTNLLRGSIQVTGISCFGSGSVNNLTGTLALGQSSVSGDSMHPSFRMDDGSSLLLNASATDLSGTQLSDTTLAILGGKCATTAERFVRMTALTRVN